MAGPCYGYSRSYRPGIFSVKMTAEQVHSDCRDGIYCTGYGCQARTGKTAVERGKGTPNRHSRNQQLRREYNQALHRAFKQGNRMASVVSPFP